MKPLSSWASWVAPAGAGGGGDGGRAQAARAARQTSTQWARTGERLAHRARRVTSPRARAAAALALAVGCAPRPLLEQAIRARGGPLTTVVREVEAEVHVGFPGRWRWRTAFTVPDRYAWTIFTASEPSHFLYDGSSVRAFIGGREVAVDAARGAPLRSHARFAAVVNLDALRLPGVSVAPLAPDELPPGATAALAVVFADDGSRYRLGFDERTLLVWAAGSVSLPPLGQGELTVRFADFRRARRLLLPFRTTYTFGGAPLAEEQALAVCPLAARLPEESFRAPASVPDCEVSG